MTITIIGLVFTLLTHAVAGIYSCPLKHSKKVTYTIWGVWVVLQGSLMIYTELKPESFIVKFFAGFLMSLAGQYVLFFATTKGRLAQRVFTMLTYSIFFCIFMALFTLVKSAFPHLPPILPELINVVIRMGFLYYFLSYICPRCAKAAPNITDGWTLLILVNLFFLISIVLTSVFPIKLTNFNDPAVTTFLFLSVSILITYPIIFSNISHLSEIATKRNVERQNKLLLTQIEMENMQLAAASQARHDRRHHNLVMLEFANNNDIESVREYLKNLVSNDSRQSNEVKHCDNTTINTVLTVYERRAKENGIRVKISADVSRTLDIQPQDLVIVIANLFENAIHATEKMKSKNKRIDISIRESAQRLLIKIENACKEKMFFDESLYGVGLHSVIAATNKYDGMYDFSAKDGVFSAKISLNLK